MGGLTSRGFCEARFELCKDYVIEKSLHNFANGTNPTLDERLEQVPLLSNWIVFQRHMETFGISFSSLTRFMCYMGFGSKIVNEKYPDLILLDHIIRGLRRLSVESNMKGKLSLLEERKKVPKYDSLFRLIRPFFLHRFSEGLVAILSSTFFRDSWKWNWVMMENTLAVLHRYIPRGLARARITLSSRNFICCVQVTGQVGLQGQELLSNIIGRVQQLLELKGKPRRYCKDIGPSAVLANSEMTLETFACFQTTLPPVYGPDRIHPERLFKDIVVLVSTQGIFERFDAIFQVLVREMENISFKADPPLSVNAARKKRNQIYEKNLGGKGNPWCYQSWNFKMTVKRKRCQPELGWKACTRITDYLSGTIHCADTVGLRKVWQKLKNMKMFKICKMINRLGTVSREMLCIGKLNINPPVWHYFNAIEEDKLINTMVATIRIRWTTYFEDYDHFEIARKNYLLNSFYSPEQFFIPRVCNYEKELLDEKENLIATFERKCQKKPRKKRKMKESIKLSYLSSSSQPLPTTQKRVCPKDHPLIPVPVFEQGRKCGACRKGVNAKINWFCDSCNWISCNDCCLLGKGTLGGTERPPHKHGSSINFNSKSLVDVNTELDKMNDRRAMLLLQDALIEKDQRVRDLERWMQCSSKSEPLQTKKTQSKLGGSLSVDRENRINRSSFAKLRNLFIPPKTSLKLKESTSYELMGEKRTTSLIDNKEDDGEFVNIPNIMTDSHRQTWSLGDIDSFLRTSTHPPEVIKYHTDGESVIQHDESSAIGNTKSGYDSSSSSSSTISNIIIYQNYHNSLDSRGEVKEQIDVNEENEPRTTAFLL